MHDRADGEHAPSLHPIVTSSCLARSESSTNVHVIGSGRVCAEPGRTASLRASSIETAGYPPCPARRTDDVTDCPDRLGWSDDVDQTHAALARVRSPQRFGCRAQVARGGSGPAAASWGSLHRASVVAVAARPTRGSNQSGGHRDVVVHERDRIDIRRDRRSRGSLRRRSPLLTADRTTRTVGSSLSTASATPSARRVVHQHDLERVLRATGSPGASP